MVVLKSEYLWLQRAIKFMPRRLTKAVLTFFAYKLICLIRPRLRIAFCRSNIMRLTSLWSLPYLILKSPWEAVKVSELCCSRMGAALAKLRVVLCVRCCRFGRWDDGVAKLQSVALDPVWFLRSREEMLRLPAGGFIMGKRRQRRSSFPLRYSEEGSKFHREIIMLLEKVLWQLTASQVEFLWGKSHVRHNRFLPLFSQLGMVYMHSVVLKHLVLISLPLLSLPASG